jgi:hypothetical protein
MQVYVCEDTAQTAATHTPQHVAGLQGVGDITQQMGSTTVGRKHQCADQRKLYACCCYCCLLLVLLLVLLLRCAPAARLL